MKKSLLLGLAIAAAPAVAGEMPLTIPVIDPAPAAIPFSLEVGVQYSWAGKDLLKDTAIDEKVNTTGIDLTGVWSLDSRQAFTLRMGYAYGDEDVNTYNPRYELTTEMHVFSLMPGYRYTHPLTEKLSFFAGANIGLAIVSVKDSVDDYATGNTWGAHGSEAGFAYTAELGINYKLRNNVSAFAAWQIGGNTAHPDVDGYANGPIQTNKQYFHGFRCGLNIAF